MDQLYVTVWVVEERLYQVVVSRLEGSVARLRCSRDLSA